jgi:hypothetical protein
MRPDPYHSRPDSGPASRLAWLEKEVDPAAGGDIGGTARPELLEAAATRSKVFQNAMNSTETIGGCTPLNVHSANAFPARTPNHQTLGPSPAETSW